MKESSKDDSYVRSTLCPLTFGQQRRVGTSGKSSALIATSRKPLLHQERLWRDRPNPFRLVSSEGKEGEVKERADERERTSRRTDVSERSTPPIVQRGGGPGR